MNAEIYFNTGILLFLSGAFFSLVFFRKAKQYIYILSAIGALNLIVCRLISCFRHADEFPCHPDITGP